MLAPFSALVMAATHCLLAAEPAAGTSPLVCIGGITTEGLDDQLAGALRQKLREELARLSALSLPAGQFDRTREVGICANSARGITEEATGVLLVSAVRFGPMVRLTLQFFDAAGGSSVSESKLMLPARDLLTSAQLTRALEAGVSELRKLPRARPPEPVLVERVVAAPPPAPTPTPPPTPIPPPKLKPATAPVKKLAAVAPVTRPAPAPTLPSAPAPAQQAKGGSPLAIAGWVSGAVGAVLLVVGAGSGIGALAKYNQLETSPDCAERQNGGFYCFDTALESDIQTYQALTIGAIAAPIAGGVALATAVALVLLAPDEAAERSAPAR